MAHHMMHRDRAEAARLRLQMKTLIDHEDPAHPLSDAQLGRDLGITYQLVRYHRIKLGIKPAHERMSNA